MPIMLCSMSMYLTREEERILDGEKGEASSKAMELLVKLGDAYGAERMIEVSSCHLVSCVYNVVYDSGLEIAERFFKLGARFKVPTTLCTSSIPLEDTREFCFPDEWVEKQLKLCDLYRGMGGLDNWTCIPYWNINVPRYGEHIAWGESNCVSYANSVIGARTNRYASYIDLCAAITGRIPMIELHIPENRKGTILVKLKGLDVSKMTVKDYGALGYAIGRISVGGIPVIDGLPGGVSKNMLRVMGAAAASSGSVALYHVLGVTPEARSLEEAFRWDKPEDRVEIGLEEFREAYRELSTVEDGRADLVFIGCPHYSIDQIGMVVDILRGRKVHPDVELWLATDNLTYTLACRMGYRDILARAGVKFMVGSCAMNAPTYTRRFNVMATDSAKTAHYAPMQAKTDVFYGSLEECIEIAVEGRIPI